MAGNFELNVMMLIMALRLLEAIEFTANVVKSFSEKCVVGIEANEERCKAMVEQSLAMVTALAPVIGYDRAAKIAKEAFSTGKTVREVALAHKVLPPEKLAKNIRSVADDRAGNPGEELKIEDGESRIEYGGWIYHRSSILYLPSSAFSASVSLTVREPSVIGSKS